MGQAVGHREERRDGADVPDLVVGEARGPGAVQLDVGERGRLHGEHECEVDDRALALRQLDAVGVGGDPVGDLGVLCAHPQDRPVGDHAVRAVVGPRGGDDDQLALGLGQAVVGVHQRVVVVEERPQLPRAAGERAEHVRHEAGLLRDDADPFPQVVGHVRELDMAEPADLVRTHAATLGAARSGRHVVRCPRSGQRVGEVRRRHRRGTDRRRRHGRARRREGVPGRPLRRGGVGRRRSSVSTARGRPQRRRCGNGRGPRWRSGRTRPRAPGRRRCCAGHHPDRRGGDVHHRREHAPWPRARAGGRARRAGGDRRCRGRDPGRGLVEGVEVRVDRRGGQQFLVAADGADGAPVEDDDLVGVGHRVQVVRDDDRGAARHQPAQRSEHPLPRRGVQPGGRLVEEQHRRVADHGAGDRQPLALAAGEQPAALADPGVVAVVEPRDEPVGVGGFGRRAHLRVGGVGLAPPDVLGDGAVEDEGLLQHRADVAAQIGEGQLAQVDARRA